MPDYSNYSNFYVRGVREKIEAAQARNISLDRALREMSLDPYGTFLNLLGVAEYHADGDDVAAYQLKENAESASIPSPDKRG